MMTQIRGHKTNRCTQLKCCPYERWPFSEVLDHLFCTTYPSKAVLTAKRSAPSIVHRVLNNSVVEMYQSSMELNIQLYATGTLPNLFLTHYSYVMVDEMSEMHALHILCVHLEIPWHAYTYIQLPVGFT